MKIRWTQDSVRFRISPTELETLLQGSTVSETLTLSGDNGWRAAILPGRPETTLTLQNGVLSIALAEAYLRRLAEPDIEGIYFQQESDPPIRYYIEKDFPCAHPRASEAREPARETFAPPEGFLERKSP